MNRAGLQLLIAGLFKTFPVRNFAELGNALQKFVNRGMLVVSFDLAHNFCYD